MYTPRPLVPSFDLKEQSRFRDRWISGENREYVELILKLIREGAGEDFLQQDFESGRLPILEDMWDLRGFNLHAEEISFPRGDTFEAIDFSYGHFVHCTLRNAFFYVGFNFTDFYSCTFEDCEIFCTTPFSCDFKKVKFINCRFRDHTVFSNCVFSQTDFVNCFFDGDFSFSNCSFDHEVSFKGFMRKWSSYSMAKNRDADLLASISSSFDAGNVPHIAEQYYFKARHAATRHNTTNFRQKLIYLFEEFLSGYGTSAIRALLFLLVLYFFATIFFLCVIPDLNISDGIVFSAGAIFTFGAFGEKLANAGFLVRLVYVSLSFLGIAGTALFVTTLASKWLKRSIPKT